MGNRRWQHLDLRKPAPHTRAPETTHASTPADGPTADPEFPRAAALMLPYPPEAAAHRHQYEQVAVMARAALDDDPASPDARRLLGMALGHLQRWRGAEAALNSALELAPDDAMLRAALQSAQIQLGVEPLPLSGAETGPAAEIAGAVCWISGQRRLAEGNPTEGAQLFEQAGSLLAKWSPVDVRAERVAACFIARAVALLLAGEWSAAQRGFWQLEPEVRGVPRSAGQTRALVDFARQLYGVADALPELTPAEQDEALQPLRDLVLNARLHVRFYDGTLPVAMYWETISAKG